MIFSFPNLLQQFIPSFRVGTFMSKFDKKQILKSSNYEYNRYQSYKIGNLNFNISKQYSFNFDTPIPAISESYVLDYQKLEIFPQPVDKNNLKKDLSGKNSTLKKRKNSTTQLKLSKRLIYKPITKDFII
ncbi:hypothetical protein [Chryseobacterium indoltheticum]|uniref:hypothetical protein n=1 Tax=Chryseobacterium indoltheticum TaxID=254 RepID=UPI003F49969C